MRIQLCGFWGTFRWEDSLFGRLLGDSAQIVTSDPDIRICSVFGSAGPGTVPSIFYSGEPGQPPRGGYDLNLTFCRAESERDMRLPNHAMGFGSDQSSMMRDDAPGWDDRNGIDYIYRHGQGMRSKAREVLAMAGHEIVDGAPPGYLEKIKVQGTTKWSITMEKVRESGYVSEKILHAFVAGSVPIYYGDIDVGLDFNEAAMIHVRDESELADLSDMLTRERWEECRAAPMFPGGLAPHWWDRDRLMEKIRLVFDNRPLV